MREALRRRVHGMRDESVRLSLQAQAKGSGYNLMAGTIDLRTDIVLN